MEQFQINSIQHLKEELDWAERVLFMETIPGVAADLLAANPPALSGDSNYAAFIKKYKFNLEQRFIFALALAPHFQPAFFESFFKKNEETGDYFATTGGKKAKYSMILLPTVETAIFLLSRKNLEKRIRVMPLFDADGMFMKEQLLSIGTVEAGEPQYSGLLTVPADVISLVIFGKKSKPVFGDNFPAKLLETKMNWEDLILDEITRNQVNDISTWIQHRNVLMEDLQLSKKVKPGYRVLFYGPPGTGKTLVAALLGNKTGRDVYRIDLSLVVSKYIGETEKNLAKIFDKASHSDSILFFDEADALFGARTKVESSHDRYANQEVSYLLQRIEDYDGLAILATNLKSNIDNAFIRRFQSIVYFPLPKPGERLQLWEKAFSEKVPADKNISLQDVAGKYELSGALILNIVFHATLKALGENSPVVTMKILQDSIARELAKEGKTL